VATKSKDSRISEMAVAAYLETVRERTETCTGTFQSNCAGTALFIAGEQDDDVPIDIIEVSLLLRSLEKSHIPRAGILMAWERDSPDGTCTEHVGVLTSASMNALRITSRNGANGNLVVDQHICLAEEYQNLHPEVRINFYVPNRLALAESGIIPNPQIAKEKKEDKADIALKKILIMLHNQE
jgi:hypothetical protein